MARLAGPSPSRGNPSGSASRLHRRSVPKGRPGETAWRKERIRGCRLIWPSAVLGSVTSAAEDEDHGVLSLQFGELSVFGGVVGQLIVGEDSPWNDVRANGKSSGGSVSA